MSDGIEEYRKRMEEKFKKDNENKEKDNKQDSKQPNEQPPNPDADYEYARRLQEMVDNEEHEVYDMRNINTVQAGGNTNNFQRQKSAPRPDAIELNDMSRPEKGNRAPMIDKKPQNRDDHRVGFDDYGGSIQHKGSFFDSIKDKFGEIWEDMSQQGKCSAVTTCVCCFLILIVVFSSL